MGAIACHNSLDLAIDWVLSYSLEDEVVETSHEADIDEEDEGKRRHKEI